MSQAKAFRHQAYRSTPPTSPHHLLTPEPCPPVGSEEFCRRMQRVGDVLRGADVARIYLVHGTFVGPDAMGVLAELGRIFPAASESVRRVIKGIVDKVTGEAGNYTRRYARCFENALHTPSQRRIPVELFHWSSENHHLGRADGAVRLLDELATCGLEAGQRALLLGHSHAGNVFALVSNLLGGDRAALEGFFQAAAIYYRWPVVGCVDIPVWHRVRQRLADETSLPHGVALDMATFGTPVRYGWNRRGYAQLLHFINHRPAEGLPAYRASFPPKVDDILTAAEGDYVQQLGIAGTNVMPSVLSWRAWMADNRLKRLLQGDSGKGSVLERFRAGTIVPDEGTTLLVDYGPPQGNIAQHIAGHAVYTRPEWMLFHAEQIVRRFYQGDSSDGSPLGG